MDGRCGSPLDCRDAHRLGCPTNVAQGQGLLELINESITAVMGSPWVYVAVFLVCALDAFFPVVPSETSVIAASAVAASGGLDGQSLALIIAVAFAGAFLGDHISYALGFGLGRPAAARLLRGDGGRTALERTERLLRTRGGVVIVALRFIPGGRMATTFTAGVLRFPLGRFVPFDALAAASWATYSGLIGHWAGGVFQGNHLLAVTVGIGVSVVITVVVETVRFLVRRRRRAAVVRRPAGGENPEDRVIGGVR